LKSYQLILLMLYRTKHRCNASDDQAEADLKVARAKAEERRAAAVASEQENIAEVAKQRARVVEAEAEVPKSNCRCFQIRKTRCYGLLSAKNIQADTEMRDSIAKHRNKEN